MPRVQDWIEAIGFKTFELFYHIITTLLKKGLPGPVGP